MISRFEAENVDVGLWGDRIRAEGLTVGIKGFEAPLVIDESIVVEADTGGHIPNRMHVKVNGIHVNAADDLFAFLKPLLDELGYENLSARLELEYAYDAERKTVHVKKFMIAAGDVGELTGESVFTNIDLEQALQGGGGLNPLQMALSLPMTNLNRGHLDFRDDSLMERISMAEAERKNLPVETSLDQVLTQYRNGVKHKEHPQVRDALKAIETFLKDPNRITVSASPEEPVSILQMILTNDFGGLIRLLNLTFKV